MKIHNSKNLKRISLDRLMSAGDKLIARLSRENSNDAKSLCMTYRRNGKLTARQYGYARELLGEKVL